MKTASMVALVLGLSGSAMAQQVVGYVARVDGDASQTKLLRGSEEPRPVRIAEYVLTGDTIVAPRAVRIRVDTRAGSIDPCAGSPDGECRFLFTTASGRATVSEMGDRLAGMLSWFGSQPRNLVVRSGGAPVARYGSGTPQKLGSGKRSLWIGWASGTSPFRVSVLSLGRELGRVDTPGRFAHFAELDLPRGPVKFRVEDAKGNHYELVATAGQEPPKPPDFAPNAIDSSHARLLEAAWLASQEKGAWSLEAAQRPDASPNSAGEQFRAALLTGSKP